jgi:hypothetical protein
MKQRSRNRTAQKEAAEDEKPFSEWYDSEDDIYYVTIHSGEPSIVNEVEDDLLVEVGVFTGLPNGLRILNFQRGRGGECFPHKALQAVDALFEAAMKRFTSLRTRTETRFEKRLEKVFA